MMEQVISPELFNQWKQTSERVVEQYSSLAETYGNQTRQAVGWIDNEKRLARFTATIEGIPDIESSSFLEVGSGNLGFYQHVRHTLGIDMKNYTGLEMVPDFVEHARKEFPEVKVVEGDFLSFDAKESSYDYVVFIGSLVLDYPNYLDYLKYVISKAVKVAHKGVRLNLFRKEPEEEKMSVVGQFPLGGVADPAVIKQFVERELGCKVEVKDIDGVEEEFLVVITK